MLTRKQHELLMFIHEQLGKTSVSPSFDEMKEALGLKSKSGIHRLITGLVERGFIRRLPHRARALEVLRLPDGSPAVHAVPPPPPAPAPGGTVTPLHGRGRFQPNIIQGNFSAGLAGREATGEGGAIALPLYGRIAAGTPIEALRDHSVTVEVPAHLISQGEHYALQVAGNSMVDAGILDGDTVVIQRGQTAENGTIVVALVDENEVTLKRLRRKGHTVALEPANPSYETRIFGADRVQIQGKLVGLIRRY